MTKLSISTEGPPSFTLQSVYDRMEYRASFLMGGWGHVKGVTPDDLALEALDSYLSQMANGVPAEDAQRMASKGLQQDVRNLYQKEANNPVQPFDSPRMAETPDDDVEDSLEEVEASWLYFSPEQMDWMADRLTKRQLEAVILVHEEDLTQEEAATRLMISERRVGQLLQEAYARLRLDLVSNEDVTE